MGIFRVGVILGGYFPVGNCLGESYPGWVFSGWEFSRWELSGGNHPGGNFPGGSFHVTIYFKPI